MIVTLILFAALPICGCVDSAQRQPTEASSPTVYGSPEENGPSQASGASVIPAAPEDQAFQTTRSGLQYRVIRPGDGRKPTAADTVLCHYHGTLENGTVFDSSYQRGEPIDFPLNGVIAGWTEGLQLINEGGAIELVIPSDLGYGPRGTPGGPIPPNATLRFTVELQKIL